MDSEGSSNNSFLDGFWSCTASYKFLLFSKHVFKKNNHGVGGIREAEILKILMHYKISHSPDGCPPVCCVERYWHRQSPAFTCPESAGKWNDALQYKINRNGNWNEFISVAHLIGNKFQVPVLQLARASWGMGQGHPVPCWVRKWCHVSDLGTREILT